MGKKRKIENHKTKFIGYRNYLLVKIILSNGWCTYLLEIDRKDSNESFLGMILKPDTELDKYMLSEILFEVMKKQGVLKNIEITALNKMTFKHAIKDETLNENMKKTLKRVMKKKLFI